MTTKNIKSCILSNNITIIILIIFLFPFSLESQRKNKGTSKREIRKRQETANKKSNYNKFNELVPMGSAASIARNDYIWSYETANTVPLDGGNISLISPTRLCFRKGQEIGTSIGSAAFIPMLYYKRKWKEGKIYIATRHQLYSFLPGLQFMRNNNHFQFIPEDSSIPEVIAVKNELIVSKPFLKDLKCGSVKQPYIIITAGIAYDYGIKLSGTDVNLIDYKFVRSRNGVILGDGGFLSARLQGDFYLNQNLYLTVAARGLFTNETYKNSFEQNSLIRYKISPKLSIDAGYWMNFGKGDGTMILPVFDITYYFGSREIREKGLFGKGKI